MKIAYIGTDTDTDLIIGGSLSKSTYLLLLLVRHKYVAILCFLVNDG